ncbi:MAG TPA: histidine kinase [Parafilimonas sp.]|nr:histidine kinase [Parafilimonas sp.]
MKFRLPQYTTKDYTIMAWTMFPLGIVINILVFGKLYFTNLLLFFSATIITIALLCIDFIACGAVAVTMKQRLPADSDVGKRLSFMIIIFIILSGLVLYGLFSFYSAIRFFGYSFSSEGFIWSYFSLGMLNIFLTLLHESVSRFERWKANLQETEQLKKTVMQSQLLGLKSQLNPHFLFNCLNSLSSLISEDESEAERFLNEMSKVYRYILRNDDDILVSLEKELQFIQSYYLLLKARYGDGLELSIQIDDKDLQAFLPPLSLQVILENAFSQNTMQKSSPLVIKICSDKTNAIIIKNNIQRKQISDAFDFESGLDNLVNKYRLLNEGEVVIRDLKDERVITLPLIKKQPEVRA